MPGGIERFEIMWNTSAVNALLDSATIYIDVFLPNLPDGWDLKQVAYSWGNSEAPIYPLAARNSLTFAVSAGSICINRS